MDRDDDDRAAMAYLRVFLLSSSGSVCLASVWIFDTQSSGRLKSFPTDQHAPLAPSIELRNRINWATNDAF